MHILKENARASSRDKPEKAEAVKKLEMDYKRSENKKMEMEFHIADIVNDHKKDKTQLKMMKIKRYALEKDICLQYAFGEILS